MKIEIYSINNCPYCTKAKEIFNKNGFEFTNYLVDGKNINKTHIQKRVDALGINTKISTVPQIFIDDQYVGGHSELVSKYAWAK